MAGDGKMLKETRNRIKTSTISKTVYVKPIFHTA